MNRRTFILGLVSAIPTLAGCIFVGRTTTYNKKVPLPSIDTEFPVSNKPALDKALVGPTYCEAGETDEWWNYEVFLNGTKVERAYKADSVVGWVDSWNSSQHSDRPNTLTRQYGKVEIRRKGV